MMFSPKILCSKRMFGDWLHEGECSPQQDLTTDFHCIDRPGSFYTSALLHTGSPASCLYNGVNAELVISPQFAAIASVSNGRSIHQWSSCRFFTFHYLTFPSVCIRELCCATKDTSGRIVDLVSSWKEHHQLQDLVLSFWAVVSIALAQAALCKTLIPVFSGVWSVTDLLVQGEEQQVQ